MKTTVKIKVIISNSKITILLIIPAITPSLSTRHKRNSEQQ